MSDIESRGYKVPSALVSTEWVAQNANNPKVRIIESNEDQLLYKSGHIPNAVEVDWVNDLNNSLTRDYVSDGQFRELMSRIGVTPDTTVVFYGDKNNWWAAYALWVFQLFGHTNAKIMDGGRIKWQKEDRPMTRDLPTIQATDYPACKRIDTKLRAFRDDVLKHSHAKLPMVDVRSPEEYRGERLHMPDYPNEGAVRGGHVPGAKSMPWAKAINTDDGTFKSASELQSLYEKELGLKPRDDVIVYCRIGERSSHTWFVLNYLLGYQKVRLYVGSWTEWGNSVGLPIEKP